jgi:hypothetical protein
VENLEDARKLCKQIALKEKGVWVALIQYTDKKISEKEAIEQTAGLRLSVLQVPLYAV